MPLYLWACPLVQGSPRPVWMPKVLSLMTEGARIEWVTTPGGTGSWAVGAANWTTTEAAALDADTQVHMILASNAANVTVGSLSAARRNRLRTFCTDAGISSPPNGETIRSVFLRLVSHIEPVKTLEYLEGRAV